MDAEIAVDDGIELEKQGPQMTGTGSNSRTGTGSNSRTLRLAWLLERKLVLLVALEVLRDQLGRDDEAGERRQKRTREGVDVLTGLNSLITSMAKN